MTLLLYAVVPIDARVPDGLEALYGARTGVLYAEQVTVPPADRAALEAFDRVIEGIAREGPLLPMRFGTAVPALEDLRLLVTGHEEGWATRLDVVAGCCELHVHLMHARTVVPAAHDAVRDELRAVLHPWLREARSLTVSESDRVAVLVPADRADRARALLEQWASERVGLDVEITGPCPPYSFCEPAA